MYSTPKSGCIVYTCSKVTGLVTGLLTVQRWQYQQGHHMHCGLPRNDMQEKAKPHLQCVEGQHSAQRHSTCLSICPYCLPSALSCSCCVAFAASRRTLSTLCFAALSCLKCSRLCLVLSLLSHLTLCDCLYTVTRTASVLCLWV